MSENASRTAAEREPQPRTEGPQHTPGPWEFVISEGFRVVQEQSGQAIAEVKISTDARLIAAAPEMAAILKELVENYSIGAGNTQAEADARAVLQKAGVINTR